MRKTLIAAGCAALFVSGGFASADDRPAGTMPAALAHQVVDRTIELVESKELYGRIRKLLGTLDTNGHSFIWPANPQAQGQLGQQGQSQGRVGASAALRPPTFKLVTTSRGRVLRWTPPAIVEGGMSAARSYLGRFYDEAAARPDIAEACALVVDLSEQTGDNAWPPSIAMYPLFGSANKARWVDRDGRRTPLVVAATLQETSRYLVGDRANPLARFGSASYGLSTANKTYTLADGSTLVPTEMRFAPGDGPVYQGAIAPMHPAEKGAPAADAVRMAAEWAAANSPRCGAKARAA